MRRTFFLGMGFGAFVAALLTMFVLGVRPDLAEAVRLPMFWVKLAFAGTLLAASALAAVRLQRPGVPLAWLPAAVAMPVLAMWCFAAFALARAHPEEWPQLVLGDMWLMCTALIVALSVPVLVGVLWGMRGGLLPARPRLAGGAAGLAAGATAALIYTLHCPEMNAPFVAVWYSVGMLVPAGLGALLGPRLLRNSGTEPDLSRAGVRPARF
jgi:hypothetical protein